MRKLTESQKEFLLNSFFENEKFPGWRSIATTLLETGKCIVAGETCIWRGGIGNFIKTSPAEGTVGCSLYEFDLEYFLTSAWYKEVKEQFLVTLKKEEAQADEKLKELKVKIQDLKSLYLNNE